MSDDVTKKLSIHDLIKRTEKNLKSQIACLKDAFHALDEAYYCYLESLSRENEKLIREVEVIQNLRDSFGTVTQLDDQIKTEMALLNELLENSGHDSELKSFNEIINKSLEEAERSVEKDWREKKLVEIVRHIV